VAYLFTANSPHTVKPQELNLDATETYLDVHMIIHSLSLSQESKYKCIAQYFWCTKISYISAM